jgi:glycosyltransferase involved in cell wall biosynthesis
MPTNITCIIPTHERNILLLEALTSIARQSLQPLEVIVSDNINSPTTKDIVNQFNINNKLNAIYLGHDKGGRGCISRNLAAEKARGDLLAFLDDDDMWLENYLEKMVECKEASKTEAVYSWLLDFSGNLEEVSVLKNKMVPKNLKPKDFVLRNPGTVISNLVVDKNVFLELGGFDESVITPYDKDFVIRLLQAGFNYDVL